MAHDSVFMLGILGIVAKYPSVGGIVTLMLSFPIFSPALTSD